MSSYYSNQNECSSCQELHAKVIELRDALRNATQLKTADQVSKPPSHGNGIQMENISSNILDFEFSLSLEDVHQYIIRSFNVDKIKDIIWFSGTLDKHTGKVITATTGKKPQESTIEDSSKDHSSSNSSSNGSSYYRFHH